MTRCQLCALQITLSVILVMATLMLAVGAVVAR